MSKADKIVKPILIVVLIVAILGGYYALSNRDKSSSEEADAVSGPVEEVLMWDLENHYPATPKEVVKYYSELTKVFYGEDYSDAQLEALAEVALSLYDVELANNKPKDVYLMDLKSEIAGMKSKDYVIYSYSPSASTDVVYFEKDGHECASLYCTYTFRLGTTMSSTEEIYILRKDFQGHWKILGWEAVDRDE